MLALLQRSCDRKDHRHRYRHADEDHGAERDRDGEEDDGDHQVRDRCPGKPSRHVEGLPYPLDVGGAEARHFGHADVAGEIGTEPHGLAGDELEDAFAAAVKPVIARRWRRTPAVACRTPRPMMTRDHSTTPPRSRSVIAVTARPMAAGIAACAHIQTTPKQAPRDERRLLVASDPDEEQSPVNAYPAFQGHGKGNTSRT